MNNKKQLSLLLFAIIAVGLLCPPVIATAETETISDLLPSGEGYKWVYHGFAEYGHEITADEASQSLLDKFTDLPENTWYMAYTAALLKRGIINGYPDGTFRPQNVVKVSEFIKMVLGVLGYSEVPTRNSWYENYIARALKLNIIKEGDFDSFDRPITRQEMASVIVRAMQEEGIEGSSFFSDDNRISPRLKPYVKKAASLGLLEGYPDNTFKPENSLTRAEASKVAALFLRRVNPSGRSLTKQEALELEQRLEQSLVLTTNQDMEVTGYNRKSEVVKSLSGFMSLDLAQEFADTYYREAKGKLYLTDSDSPLLLRSDKPFDIEKISDNVFLALQAIENGQKGELQLIIEFSRCLKGWMITGRTLKSNDSPSQVPEILNYKVLDYNIPENLNSIIDGLRSKRGYALISSSGSEHIIFIGAGQKPSAGYDITVKYIENVNGKIVITVDETAPKPGSLVATVLTYPSVVIKVNTTSQDFQVVNMKGESFDELQAGVKY